MQFVNAEGKPCCAPRPIGCGKEIDSLTEFKDELSAKEYTISGLCQACQDDFFCTGKPDCNKPCCKD